MFAIVEELKLIPANTAYSFPEGARPPIIQTIIDKIDTEEPYGWENADDAKS